MIAERLQLFSRRLGKFRVVEQRRVEMLLLLLLLLLMDGLIRFGRNDEMLTASVVRLPAAEEIS